MAAAPGAVTASGSIRAISGLIEYKDVITQQAVQEISPAYVNCSGFIESTYNGIIEQTEFNAPQRRFVCTSSLANSDGPSYCPRYEIELWFRSEVSWTGSFDPALIGQFTGLGDVVAYLQQDGDSIEERPLTKVRLKWTKSAVPMNPCLETPKSPPINSSSKLITMERTAVMR